MESILELPSRRGCHAAVTVIDIDVDVDVVVAADNAATSRDILSMAQI